MASVTAGVGFPGVLAAEWTKLTGLRSSLWVAVGTVASAGLLAYGLGMFARFGDGRTGVALVVAGLPFAQLGALVLGVLVGVGEYSAGTATATFTAVPRRLPVLGAQALTTLAVSLATAVAALAASSLVTSGQRAALGLALDLADHETLRVLAGCALYLTSLALLGLGIGALLRHPAAALVGSVLLVVVVDHLLASNPGRVTDTVRALLPSVGQRLVLDEAHLATLDPPLGLWTVTLVLGLWVVGALAAAAYRLLRHDVT